MAEVPGLDAFMAAIGGQESGNNPTAQNGRTGAYGTFQIMPGNWPSWAEQAGLGRNAPRTAANQYKVARFKMTQYFRQFGRWDAVAVAWYAGPDDAVEYLRNPNQSRFTRGQGPNGNEPSIQSYVNTAMSGMKRQGGNPGVALAGSGGTSSAAATGVAATEEKKPKSRQEILDWLRENHPDIFGLLQVSPEIKDLAFKAAEGEWDRAKIKGALAKTKYYKTTIAAARTWDSNFAQDEVTGKERLARSEQEINTLARQLGVTVSAEFVAKLALNVNRLGWTDLMVRQALAAKFRQSTATAGAGTVTVDTLRAIAAQYAVPVSDHSLTKWTRDILGGLSDENAFRSRMAEHAKRLLPDIADEIDEGRTVADYFDPYAEIASSLGVLANPAEFDLSDNKWRRAVMKVDPDTGKRVVRDLDEWETELRTNRTYGYTRTRRGRQEAADIVTAFERATGMAV